jgi:radical SAM protein (TIGR01212 family)
MSPPPCVGSASPLITTFSHHYRAKYGQPIGKIPIDTGRVCPNRAHGGCIFCRPASFTPGYLDKADDVTVQIARGRQHLAKGRFRKYFAYFQQETCTALPAAELLGLLRALLADSDCVGVILSTRPDHVPDSLLTGLAECIVSSGKECLFELGLQTVHERSLQLLNRNHGFADFLDAAARIKSAGPFGVGAHLIFGIPGESIKEMLHSLTTVCAIGLDALKLHHLQVIRDTPLHEMYARGRMTLFSLEEYLDFLLLALPLIPASVTIHRLWATSHPDLLVAPRWHVLAAELSRTLEKRMIEQGIRQGQRAPMA